MSEDTEIVRSTRHCQLLNHEERENNEEQIGSTDTLNDFCWLQIFDKLSLTDLCNVANVNKQFKKVAMMSFSGRYAVFYYPYDLIESKSYQSQMRRVLCNFGHLIKSLRLKDSYCSGPIEMNVISKYCAGTLLKLTLKLVLDLDCDSAMPLFESLIVLKIDCYGCFNGNAIALFKECKKLRIFKIVEVPSTEVVSEIVQHYPNLKELYIHDIKLNLRTMFAILKLNPQIKKLDTFNDKATKAICLIANKLEKLEELILRYELNEFDSSYAYLHEIGKLKSLKVLELQRMKDKFVPAIDALKNVPLERLKWFNCPSNLQFIDNILKLKTLKSLTLSPIPSHFDVWLTKLARQLPLLENLELVFIYGKDAFFTTDGLKSLIGTSLKLNSLSIHTHHSHLFNQQFYDSLLKVIRKRSNTKMFTLTIEGSASKSLQMQSNLLHLEYVREECKYYYCSKLHWSFEDRRDHVGTYSFFSRMPYF